MFYCIDFNLRTLTKSYVINDHFLRLMSSVYVTFNEIAGGGLTVPSNLRIMQWQACKKKNNKLEFLIPWWDLQVGISINQFLSIFAISNADFRLDAVYIC